MMSKLIVFFVISLSAFVSHAADVSLVSPTGGSFVGASLTVTGTGFADGCIVQLSNTATYADATTLKDCNGNYYNAGTGKMECVTPLLTAGDWYVFVKCAGTAQTSSTQKFTPAAPTVASVTPASTTSFAGTSLSVGGTNFGCGCEVILSTSTSSSTQGALSCVNPSASADGTTITCTTPTLTAPQQYTAWVKCGSSTSATGQSYTTTTTVVTSINVNAGAILGAPVEITGNYFSTTGCSVSFDTSSTALSASAIACTNVAANTCANNACTKLTCNTGTMVLGTTYYAWVTCNGLPAAIATTVANVAFIPGAPTVSTPNSVSQNSATSAAAFVTVPAGGAQTVRVYGTNFGTGCSVSLSTSQSSSATGSVSCQSSSYVSSSTIDCVLPATGLTANQPYYPWVTCGSSTNAANSAGSIVPITTNTPLTSGVTVSPSSGSALGAVLTFTAAQVGTNCVPSLSTDPTNIVTGAVACTPTEFTSTTITCYTATTGTTTVVGTVYYPWIKCGSETAVAGYTTFTPGPPTVTGIIANSGTPSTSATSDEGCAQKITVVGTNLGAGCSVVFATATNDATAGVKTCFNVQPTNTINQVTCMLDHTMTAGTPYYPYVTCGSAMAASAGVTLTPTAIAVNSLATTYTYSTALSTAALASPVVTITSTAAVIGTACSVKLTSGTLSNPPAVGDYGLTCRNIKVTSTSITCVVIDTLAITTTYKLWVACPSGTSGAVSGTFTTAITTVASTSVNYATTSTTQTARLAAESVVVISGTNFGAFYTTATPALSSAPCTVGITDANTGGSAGGTAAKRKVCANPQYISTSNSVSTLSCSIPIDVALTAGDYYLWVTCGTGTENTGTNPAKITISAVNGAATPVLVPSFVGTSVTPSYGPVRGAVLTFRGLYLGTSCLASLGTSFTDSTAGKVDCTATSFTSTAITCVAATALTAGTTYYPWITCGTESTVGRVTTYTAGAPVVTKIYGTTTGVAATSDATCAQTVTIEGLNIGQGCVVSLSTSPSDSTVGAKTCFNPQATTTAGQLQCTLDPSMTAAQAYYPFVTCGSSAMSLSAFTKVTPTALTSSGSPTFAFTTSASSPAVSGAVFVIGGSNLGTDCVATLASSAPANAAAATIACQKVRVTASAITCVVSSALTSGTGYYAWVQCTGATSAATATPITVGVPTVTLLSVNSVTASNAQAASLNTAGYLVISGTNMGSVTVTGSALTAAPCSVSMTNSATVSTGGTACTNPQYQTTTSSVTTLSCSLPTTLVAGDYYAWVTCGTSSVNTGTNPAKVTISAVNQASALTVTYSGTDVNTLPGTTLTVGTWHSLFAGCTMKLAASATSSTGAVSCINPKTVSATPVVSMTCQTPQLAAGTYYVYATCGSNNYPASTGSFIVGASSGQAIASVSPTTLSSGTGQTVTVTGSGLASTFAVTVCGVSQGLLSASNTFTMSNAVPVGICPVVIYNGALGSGVQIAGSASVTISGPTITAVAVSSLPLLTLSSSSQTLTITGTNLVSTCTVTVGSATCIVGTLTGTVTMPCTIAPGTAIPAGSASVVITCGLAKSNAFILTAVTPVSAATALTVSQINASSAPMAVSLGGSPIAISGTGFTPTGCTVKVGDGDCTSPTYISATNMTCNTPSTLATNLYPVVVTCNNFVSTGGSFVNGTVPTVTGVTPLTTSLQGTTITVTGTNFGTACTIGLTPPGQSRVDCTPSVWVSPTTMTCVTPALSASTGIVVSVTCNNVQSTGTSVFITASAPTITDATPKTIGLDGTTLTVTGTNFGTGCSVTLTPSGGSASTCTNTKLISTTSMNCTTPTLTAQSGVVVSVTCNTVKTVSTAVAVAVAAPTVTAVSPSTISLASTTITVTGTGFGASCSIGLTPSGGSLTACLGPMYVSDTIMTCTTPSFGAQSGIVVSVTCSGTKSTSTSVTLTAAAPTISAVSTSAGATSTVAACTPTALTVTGTGFGQGCAVTLTYSNTLYSCNNNIVVSDTTIMCTTPSASPFNAPISGVVVSVTCNGVSTSGNSVTISTAAPSVTGIAVDSATISTTATGSVSGSSLTIQGANFGSSSCTVSFTVWCSTLTCTSSASKSNIVPTNYTATVLQISAAGMPDLTFGTYLVKITCGTAVSTSTSILYTVAAPTLSSISPTTVTATLAGTGTNLVTVTGTNFGDGCVVSVGTTWTAIPTTYVSSTTLTFAPLVSFTASATAQKVVVTCTNVPSTAATVTLTISAPAVTSVSPTAISLASGSFVSVSGSNFAPGCIVSLNSVNCLTTGFVSSSQLTCATPQSTTTSSLTLPVAVTCGTTPSSGTVQNVTAAIPTVSAAVPASITTAAFQLVNITGTNFAQAGSNGCIASINSKNCLYTTVVSSTSIICTTSSDLTGIASAAVGVTCNAQAANSSATVAIGAPTITAISPTTISPSGGDVVVTGTNFASGCVVEFGSSSVVCVPTSYVYTSTSISCKAPGISSLTAQIVTVRCGTVPTTSTSVTVTPTLPTVTAATPATISVASSVVTVTGTYFYTGCVVSIGDTACATSTFASATSMTCITPTTLNPGTYAVSVTCNTQKSLTSASTPQIKVAPTVTSVSPASISTISGQTITISGTGFIGTCTVTIGGNACTAPSPSSTSITCTSPAFAAPGPVAVIVSCGSVDSVEAVKANIVAPSVTGITSAALITASGGQTVTITGTGFQTGCTINIGDAVCATPTPVASTLSGGVYTSMTCTTPALTGGSSLIVSVTCGTVKSSETSVTVTPSSGATPSAASLTTTVPMSTYGGANITILGTGFGTGCSVTVGTAGACTNIVVASSTQLQCTAPAAAAAGSQNVTITCGTSAPTAGLPVVYVAPTVTGATSSDTSTAGGFTANITGTGFIKGCSVAINGQACTNVVVVSDTLLNCTAPSLAAGNQGVVVTCGIASTSNVTLTYVAPTVASVAPSSASTAGGSVVMVNGTGFAPSCTFTVGGTACTSTTFVNSRLMSCVIPALTAGSRAVVAQCGGTTAGFTSVNSTGASLSIAPSVTSVSSTSLVTAAGGSTLTVTGTGFISGCSVVIGTTPAVATVSSATTLTVTAPALPAGPHAALVTCNNVSSVGRAVTIVYPADNTTSPIVTNVTTSVLSTVGGPIYIFGANFAAGCSATVGGAACSGVIVVSSTLMTCTAPAPASAGVAPVVVTCGTKASATGNATGAPAITYGAPTISGVSPSSITTAAGTLLSITGTNLAAGCTVTVGGSSCTAVTAGSSTVLNCTSPILQIGSAAVTVKCGSLTASGISVTVDTFVKPTVSGVSITTAGNVLLTTGGTTVPVTVTGTGFAPGCIVTVGGASCKDPAVASPTSLTCTYPAKAAGSQAVSVTCGTLTSDVTANAIYVVAGSKPTVASVAPSSLSTAGGLIAISGTNFATGCTVTVAGAACSSPMVTASDSMTCTAPALSPGSKTVVVSCGSGAGTSSTEAAVITYASPTAAAAVAAPPAPTSTTAMVTVNGTNLAAGCTVLIGGVACTDATFSGSLVQCSLPAPIVAGQQEAVVTCGTISAVSAAPLSIPPALRALAAPSAVTSAGGSIMQVIGAGFPSTGCRAFVDNVTCSSSTYVSAEVINCTTPAASVGPHMVTVTCGNVPSVDKTTAIYGPTNTPPQITYLSTATPLFTNGSIPVQISGTSFATGCSVTVNGTACSLPNTLSPTSLVCSAPAVNAPGTASVVVTCTGASPAMPITYGTPADMPFIYSVSGPVGTGGGNVTINGTAFSTGCTAKIANSTCGWAMATDRTKITCVAPPNDVGAQAVVVMCGAIASNSNVTVQYILPTASSIAPASISTAGNVSVTITGNGFGPFCNVSIAGKACPTTQPITTTSIVCLAPPNSAGVQTVSITCGAYVNSDLRLTYVAPPTPSPSPSPSPTPSPSPSPSPIDPAANPNLKLMSLDFNGINTGSLSDSQEADFEDKVDQGVCATMPPGTVCSANAPSKRRRGLLQSSTVPVEVTFAAGTSQEAMQAAMTATTAAINANFRAVFASLLAQFPSITGVTARDLSVYFTPPPPPYDDGSDDKKKKLAIGLGVGLGVGIPVVAALIFFCVWKSKRSAAGVVAPRDGSAA